MRWLTLAEVLELKHPFTEWQQNEILKKSNLADTISTLLPAAVFFGFSSDIQNGNVFEWSEIRIEHPTLIITVGYNEYQKYFNFHCKDIDDFKNISHNDKEKAKKQLQEPKQIKQLSLKKLQEQIKYLEDLHALLLAADCESFLKKEEFKYSLSSLPVTWENEEETEGYISKNGLLFVFKISESTIHTEIKLDLARTNHDLETFLQLSKNKFTKHTV